VNPNEILESLNGIFTDVFDDNDIKITRQTNADDIEDWDSVTQISLILTIENTFDIRITANELENLANVGEIADLILKKN